VFNASLAVRAIYTLLVGAVLIKDCHEGFRIFWYINTGLITVSAVITRFLYRPPPRPLQVLLKLKDKLGKLDWEGYVLLTTGITLFSIALTWSDNSSSWKDSHVLAHFIISALLLIALVFYDTDLKEDGMFHHELFRKDRNISLALVSIFAEGIGFYCIN
jgi:hypothetical protein